MYLDGCFWHGCPAHFTVPNHNEAWWNSKIQCNRLRDHDFQRLAEAEGWLVFRVWEHDDPVKAALLIRKVVYGRLRVKKKP